MGSHEMGEGVEAVRLPTLEGMDSISQSTAAANRQPFGDSGEELERRIATRRLAVLIAGMLFEHELRRLGKANGGHQKKRPDAASSDGVGNLDGNSHGVVIVDDS